MARGISIDGVSLPVTDANISYTKEPIAEVSILDNGNEIIYEGLYKNIQGTFSGAVREGLISDLLEDILANESATHTIIVADDTVHGLTASNAYLSMLEISARTGELAKFNAQFTAQYISNGGETEFASFSTDVVPFYNVEFIFFDYPGSTIKSMSIKIDRPYSADDFIFGSNTSKYISDMRQMKISGTITLPRHLPLTRFNDRDVLAFRMNKLLILIRNPFFVVGKEISISGRSPVTKTISWTCGSNALSVHPNYYS